MEIDLHRFRLTEEEAASRIDQYKLDCPAVIDLYDGTIRGPHDEVLPIDVLSLNALGAYNGSSPMSPMTRIWGSRQQISLAINPITVQPFLRLKTAELEQEVAKLTQALEVIQKLPELGGQGTRAAKLVHRLRPNIMPIWDRWIGEFYGGAKQKWDSFVRHLHTDIIKHETFLTSMATRHHLSELRLWDIILWQSRGE